MAVEYPFGARAHRENSRQQVEGFTHRPGVGIGTKVAHAFTAWSAVEKRSWDGLPHRYREHRIRFVIAVHDVEAWIEALNPRVLQLQRFHLAGHHGPFHRSRSEDHLAGPRVQLRDVLKIIR